MHSLSSHCYGLPAKLLTLYTIVYRAHIFKGITQLKGHASLHGLGVFDFRSHKPSQSQLLHGVLFGTQVQ